MDRRSEKDARYHDAIAREYDRVVVRPRAVPNDVLFRPFHTRIGRGRSMLDLGCGTGHMLVRYRARFEHAIGVDHSVGMLAVARDNLVEAGLAPAELVRSDVIEWLRAASAHFDFVSCVGVLHHLAAADRDEVLERIAQRLAPDGRAVFAEPVEVDGDRQPAAIRDWNRRSLGARVNYSVVAEEPDEGPIPETALRTAFERAGLDIVATSRMWEMSAQSERPGWLERTRIRRLARAHAANGNVLALLAVRR